jgi:hypothetical protein
VIGGGEGSSFRPRWTCVRDQAYGDPCLKQTVVVVRYTKRARQATQALAPREGRKATAKQIRSVRRRTGKAKHYVTREKKSSFCFDSKATQQRLAGPKQLTSCSSSVLVAGMGGRCHAVAALVGKLVCLLRPVAGCCCSPSAGGFISCQTRLADVPASVRFRLRAEEGSRVKDWAVSSAMDIAQPRCYARWQDVERGELAVCVLRRTEPAMDRECVDRTAHEQPRGNSVKPPALTRKLMAVN